MSKEDYKTRTLKTPDGRVIIYFDGKLHSWEGPAIQYTNDPKKKDEYYVYGMQHTKDEWLEAKRDWIGLPPSKNPNFKDVL